MGMINLVGSLRYGPSGKKRKTKSLQSKKRTIAFKDKPQYQQLVRTQEKQYKSLMEEAIKDGTFSSMGSHGCGKKESMKYTGTLVKGIATMHKSNAVPVISQKEAEDIARMRR